MHYTLNFIIDPLVWFNFHIVECVLRAAVINEIGSCMHVKIYVMINPPAGVDSDVN